MARHIVVGVTASIAVYKACELVRLLRKSGCDVEVVMTRDARKLIRPLVFASLSGNKVHIDMFEDPGAWEIEHVSLADKADAVVIAPATANIIAKIAHGICDDLLSCLVCATRAPVVIAPAMNDNMYRNRITQANIKTLQALGFKVVVPRTGELACGRRGAGCLAEVEKIAKEVQKVL